VVGSSAGLNLSSVTGDSLLGFHAGISLTSGSYNTIVGQLAATGLTTGLGNTCIGQASCSSMTGGESTNTAIGYNATTGTGVSGAIQIGSGTNNVANSVQFNSTQIIDPQHNLHAGVAAPAQGSACTAGAIVVNSGFIYVCVAANTWQRAALNAY